MGLFQTEVTMLEHMLGQMMLVETEPIIMVIQVVQLLVLRLLIVNQLQLVEVHQIYNHISLAICGRERRKRRNKIWQNTL